MPTIKFSVPHNLSESEATSRLQNVIADLKKKFGDRIQNLQESWSDRRGDFSFEAMGFRVSGSLLIEPSSVEFNGQIPMAALPFKSRIESTAKERLHTLLS
jgi:putative polyhydroxyalkanoic acid system protein